MKCTELISRVYHDGIMNEHTEDQFSVSSPVYTLFRHEPEAWDDLSETIYTIVCQYNDGSVTDHIFTNLSSAFNCFRRMVGKF